MVGIETKGIALTWKDKLLTSNLIVHYARRINEYISDIQDFSRQEFSDDSIVIQLKQSKFWEEVTNLSRNKQDIKNLKIVWENLCPFCHVSLNEIWHFKINKIDRLERDLALYVQELQQEKNLIESQYSFMQEMKVNNINSKLLQVEAIQKKLNEYIVGLQNSVYSRLKLYEINKTPKIDAPLKSIVEILNEQNLLTKIKYKESKLNSISDDLRASFYDWFLRYNPNRKQYFDCVIEPISQKGYKSYVDNTILDPENIKLCDFKHKIDNKILITAASRKKKHDNQQLFAIKVANWLGSLLLPRVIIKRLQGLWYCRWIVMQILLGGIYFWTASTYLSSLALFTGLSLGVATNIIFYGIVLLPAWIICFDILNWVRRTIFDAIIEGKKLQITHALNELCDSQIFVSSQTSSAVKDIVSFDINEYNAQVSELVIRLECLQQELNKSWFWQRWIYKDVLFEANEVSEKLKNQVNFIKKRQQLIATDLANRVGGDLKQLNKAQEKFELKPSFPLKQIENIKKFVNIHGNSSARSALEANTKMPFAFGNALAKQKIMFKNVEKSYAGTPWGNHRIDHSALSGWSTLIGSFTAKKSQKIAGKKIISLLQGKEFLHLSDIKKVLQNFEPERGEDILRHIQKHIYLTLNEYPYQFASLLSAQQKEKINKWRRENAKLVEEAKRIVGVAANVNELDRILISSKPDKDLVKYFQALEGDCYWQSINFPIKKPEINVIREYIDNYIGSDSKALYFLRFFPSSEKPKMIDHMADKRLKWLIHNSNINFQLEQTDIELFLHPLLLSKNSKFDAKVTFLQSNLFYNKYSHRFYNLLLEFNQGGLISAELLERYNNLHFHEVQSEVYTPKYSSKRANKNTRQIAASHLFENKGRARNV